MSDKSATIEAIHAAGVWRAGCLRQLEAARARFAELAPRARDEGATVQEIADAYGVTRVGAYAAIKAANSEVNRGDA